MQAGKVQACGIRTVRLAMQTDIGVRKVFRPSHEGRISMAGSILRGALLGKNSDAELNFQMGESPFRCASFGVSLVAVECRLDDGG